MTLGWELRELKIRLFFTKLYINAILKHINFTYMSRKINVGILFGGQSAEHEVSLQSAKNIFDAIDKSKYNPILIGIDKHGKWSLSNESKLFLNSNKPKISTLNQQNNEVVLIPQSGGKLYNFTTKNQDLKIDVAFPILHGPFGEDGTVQGLLKLANIPFVGSDVIGSAVGMDKDIMKRLLRDANIPISKFISFRSMDIIPEFEEIKFKLGLPLFIKPANMGSSIGVSKVVNKSHYLQAIEKACDFDNKIIIEEFIQGREIECAILGNINPRASVLGEILSEDEFYSYDAKYINDNGARLSIPVKLPPTITKQIQNLAIKTFQTLNSEGLARVDFFLTPDNKIIVNEINTMPGFTNSSMYPKLWENSGISYTELIDKLIQLAFEKFDREKT
jgi:D-alanine-D-alanine ligase